MKFKSKNLLRSSAGYTIDQTILVVAVIAVLITLIISSVGWDILNRTAGTKLASQLKQIEEVNGQFFARQGVWPHVATATSNAKNNVLVLVDRAAALAGYQSNHKNLLSSLSVLAGAVQHSFGQGGDIVQEELAGGGACGDNVYLQITFENVPLTETEEANEAVDPNDTAGNENTEGRIQWVVSGNSADVSYCANLIR